MSGETILAARPGESMGKIKQYERRPTGEREFKGSIGDLEQGVLPEKSIIASSNTHAFIATRRIPEVGTEEIVIALRDGDSRTTIDFGTRLHQFGPEDTESATLTDVDPDPELLKGALSIAMKVQERSVGVLSQDVQFASPTVLEVAGFEMDVLSGAYVFRPDSAPVDAPPREPW